MASGSRVSHTKSRNGCGQCKKRRVRCNLQAPVCANCERRNEACDYELRDAAANDQPMPGSSTYAATLGIPASSVCEEHELRLTLRPLAFRCLPSGPPPGLDILPPDEAARSLQREVFASATARVFLQHNISAIWALYLRHIHMNSTDSRSLPDRNKMDLYITACDHRLRASALFRSQVTTINASNWFDILTFAISEAVIHLGTVSPSTPLEAVCLYRKVALLSSSMQPYMMRNSIMVGLRQRQERAVTQLDLDPDAEQAVQKVIVAIRASAAPEACCDAARKLLAWLRVVACQPRSWMHFIWWPGAVTKEFLDLLECQCSEALVVIIHWCVIMDFAPKQWFMNGWSSRTGRAALGVLGPEWDGVLWWAKMKLAYPAARTGPSSQYEVKAENE